MTPGLSFLSSSKFLYSINTPFFLVTAVWAAQIHIVSNTEVASRYRASFMREEAASLPGIRLHSENQPCKIYIHPALGEVGLTGEAAGLRRRRHCGYYITSLS
ncbi:hypothetical protein N656DRAFT_50630 [Canariomyces notabilis]|uniref:Uncharacterized protein n=1 Tax=Canariomyces notabilis TaxID=2074819 RepID=A0AAN6YXE4_9PEZI|nr:hypothetical protein N656DRAFT_50630 [Canariomyces arenarius]